MTVRPARSSTLADWLMQGDWRDLVRFGPPGFERYVRVAIDAQGSRPDDDVERLQVSALESVLQVLSDHTHAVDQVYAAVWDGWTSQGDEPDAPEVLIPHRRMLLFEGPLSTIRDTPALAWRISDLILQPPHLIWPCDRRWVIAQDVDEEHEFTVGCSAVAASSVLKYFGHEAREVLYGEELFD